MSATALRIAAAQIAPVLLDREATTARVVAAIDEAATEGAGLVAFGETLLPGYPAWLSRTGGARFDDALQKELHALYLDQGVDLDEGHLVPIREAARRGGIAVVLGIAERRHHSLFASRVFIGADGALMSVHRKLRPTYEERLSWAPGDGAGLEVHPVGPFRVGALNCWENWMPLARAALYQQGEDLHVMIWPGSAGLTRDITRFTAKEGRSFTLSASGILRAEDVPADFPGRDAFVSDGDVLQDGGSCAAGPDGEWLLEPVTGREGIFVVDVDLEHVRRERQNFDPAGHYARPDVLRLDVVRERLQ